MPLASGDEQCSRLARASSVEGSVSSYATRSARLRKV